MIKNADDRFVYAPSLKKHCACYANNIVQGLSPDSCDRVGSVTPEELNKYGFRIPR